jgi:hypothetical protein
MNARRISLLALFLLLLLAAPASAADLALKRVMLSTAGLAYLEFEAQVTDDATLGLDVPLDQVDDVLKSLVVYAGDGGVSEASLPGREPLKQLFGDLPFDETALDSPAALLNALRGAEVRIGTSHPITGKLLAVVPETQRIGDNLTTTRNRVSVLTDSGLQQFVLEEAESIGFVDPALQAKVTKALAAIASYRQKDRRQITLTLRGHGTRTVRVGYVVAAPLWKATYRMTLPRALDAEKAHLQGWAVLENMTGQDWTGVELTLLSGNPVAFRQAIYESYYVNRPEVPVEVAGRVLPRPDTGIVTPAEAALQRGGSVGLLQAPAGAPVAAAAAPQAMAKAMGAMTSRSVDTAVAEEGVTQVAFRIPVPVSIASGRSAIVPIFDRDVPANRLALYQPQTSPLHPLASLRLKNDGSAGLPPGVLTLYEDAADGPAYVGDARFAGLPAGETRLLSYAVDEKTKIAREPQNTVRLAKASVAQGVLTLTRLERQTILFRIAAPAGEPRHLLLEQAKAGGWTLVEPPESSVEQTADAYRVAVELKPGESKTVTLALEAPRLQSIRVGTLDDATIAEVVSSKDIDAATRQSFGELARLRRTVADKRAAEQTIAAELGTLKDDQARIRDNLAQVDKGSTLHKRYLEKLAQQETQFEELQSDAAKAAAATRDATAAVNAYIAKLEL